MIKELIGKNKNKSFFKIFYKMLLKSFFYCLKILSLYFGFWLEFNWNFGRNRKFPITIYNAVSSRLDTGLVHDPKLTWASGESETKGKGGLES